LAATSSSEIKVVSPSDGIISHLLSALIKGIVLSRSNMPDKMEIYPLGTAWLTGQSGTLRQTIEVLLARGFFQTTHAGGI
jgi:hypothetical protein